MHARIVIQHLLYSGQNLGVGSSRRSNDALVVRQRPADSEIQSVAVNVGDLPPGLADDEVAGRVVPDLLLVGGLDGQAQVDVAGATGNGAVLGLAVHAHAGLGNSELLGDVRLVAVGGVAGLNALAEGGVGEGVDGPHGDGPAPLFLGGGGEGPAGGALPQDGGEEHTLSKVGGFSLGLNSGFTAAIGISNSGVRQLMAGQ
ncbi:unnamed protein product [Clonostachys chloroleuca]|uniref:Uncharacterized protein n=1 Tax=Clonostachys chloroleuca TaxID=1926264 RepID=A0AA35MIV2_9HYPO|nr:unnamed protein product [Clonostachys chloroleuca]